MAEFASVLRGFRRAAALTQETLAEKAGVSVEAIKTLEAGRRRYPRPATVEALAAALGLSEAEVEQLTEAAARPKARGANQLPDDLVDFVGRSAQFEDLTGRLTRMPDNSRAVVISAIAGMGGVGKTALAVHAAHAVTAAYPDGHFYLDLRGVAAAEPMETIEALGILLRRLGTPANLIPESLDEASARYRSAIAGHKMLLILDNAADQSQIEALVPGTGESAVMITSRRLMTGLPGAFHLELEVLPDGDALKLLEATAGKERLASDPDATAAVIQQCGGLPLALRIAGARLAARPDWSVADLRDRLADERSRLDVLADEDVSVRATIGLSLNDPAPADREAVALFPLLGLSEGADVDLFVVSALAGRPEREVEALLERLVDIHLLEAAEPGRYRLHDLVRVVAQELVERQLDEGERFVARLRVLDLYVGIGWKYRSSFGLGQMSGDWLQDEWLTAARDVGEGQEVVSWLDAERHNVLAAARRAVTGPIEARRLVARMLSGVSPGFVSRLRHHDWRDLGLLAVEAERSVGDPYAGAFAPFELGMAYAMLEDFPAAAEQFSASIAAPKVVEYPEHRQFCLMNLADCLQKSGRPEDGLEWARESLAMTIERQDERGEPEARLTLGMIYGRLDRREEQDEELARAAELARASKIDTQHHWILLHVGRSYRETGRPELAVPVLAEVAEFNRERGAELRLVETQVQQALAELDLGRGEQARDLLLAGLEVAERFENQSLEATIRLHLGQAYAALGSPERARTEWTTAIEICSRYGLPQVDEAQELLTRSSS
ncbi:NB-ARC domain-containing protein [Kribbella sp. NPDC051620]|uniref:NB-ARC domain-containing protein n=1 Tax=Kribbella sp. NPDC051620 TaxID=3364120 RepID=UPI003797D771